MTAAPEAGTPVFHAAGGCRDCAEQPRVQPEHKGVFRYDGPRYGGRVKRIQWLVIRGQAFRVGRQEREAAGIDEALKGKPILGSSSDANGQSMFVKVRRADALVLVAACRATRGGLKGAVDTFRREC